MHAFAKVSQKKLLDENDRIRNLEHLVLTWESAHNNTHDSLVQAGAQ